MDVFKKFLMKLVDDGTNKPKQPSFGNDFRKPIWFDDCESDDELSERKGFQVFTNPLEMQKYFEKQMDDMYRNMDGNIDENIRENFLRPGFEDRRRNFFEQRNGIDTDLDDEIYADQLHSLLQRISPETERYSSDIETYKQPTSEETVWNRIHGTMDEKSNLANGNQKIEKKLPSPRSGVFAGAFSGPKIFRQSVMIQTIHKADGSSETRRTVRNSDGVENTTVTVRTSDGKVDTFPLTQNENETIQETLNDNENASSIISGNRHIRARSDGYFIPKLW